MFGRNSSGRFLRGQALKFPESAIRKSCIALYNLFFAFVIDQSETRYLVEYIITMKITNKLNFIRIIKFLYIVVLYDDNFALPAVDKTKSDKLYEQVDLRCFDTVF